MPIECPKCGSTNVQSDYLDDEYMYYCMDCYSFITFDDEEEEGHEAEIQRRGPSEAKIPAKL